MDSLFGLSRTSSGIDEVWVIVDRITKTTRIPLVKATYTLDKLAPMYVDGIVSESEIQVSIVSNRDHRIISKFWASCNKL